MRPMMIMGDVTALGVLLGIATQVLPVLAGLLAVIWYGFVIYDRVKYGPEIDGRLRRKRQLDASTE